MIVTAGPALAHRGNCTLVAMRQVLPASVSDERILEVATSHGFPSSRVGGMKWPEYWATCRELGIQLEKVLCHELTEAVGLGETRTTARVARAFPTGTYLAGVSGHTFVIRDGVVIDPNFARARARSRARVVFLMRVMNDGWVAPVVGDSIRVMRDASAAKRRGTRAYYRFNEMHRYVWACGGSATEADVLANTSYTRADLRYDLAHGHVVRT